MIAGAQKLREREEGTPEEAMSLKNLKGKIAKTLIAGGISTSWGNEDEEAVNEDGNSKSQFAATRTVKLVKMEGLTGMSPVAIFQKYFEDKQVRR